MTETQAKWREFFKDKEWVDQKGWETKSDVVVDDYQEEYHRYYADKVSFIKTLFRTVARIIATWILSIALMTYPPFSTAGVFLMVFGTIGLIIHFIYFVVRCLLEDNLRL